jgi:hypothetical protein
MKKEKLNSILLLQSPSSPDFNALGSAVRIVRSGSEARAVKRRNLNALYDCVFKSWSAMQAIDIISICDSLVATREAAVKCDGNNEKSENFCG